jgi:Membrane protein putatively involved in post-translational modification of the autoinducing quorum-sensing peptide
MLHTVSKYITSFFVENGIIENKEELDIYEYGFELLISSFVNIAVVFIMSLFLGKVLEAIAFFLAFIPLRMFAGGYHANTHFRCFIILLFVYSTNVVLIYITPYNYIPHTILIFSICSLILVLLYSPMEDSNKPLLMDEKVSYRKVSVNIILCQIAITTVILIINKIPHILLSFSIGQLAAALALLAVKIKNTRGESNGKSQTIISKEY